MVYLIYNNGYKAYIIKHYNSTYKKIEINTNGYAEAIIGYLQNYDIEFPTIDGKNGTDGTSIKDANHMIVELLNNGFVFEKENVCDINDEVQKQLGLFYKTLSCVVCSEDLSNDEMVDVENIIKNKMFI